MVGVKAEGCLSATAVAEGVENAPVYCAGEGAGGRQGEGPWEGAPTPGRRGWSRGGAGRDPNLPPPQYGEYEGELSTDDPGGQRQPQGLTGEVRMLIWIPTCHFCFSPLWQRSRDLAISRSGLVAISVSPLPPCDSGEGA